MKNTKYTFILLTVIMIAGLFSFKSVSEPQSFLPTKLKITVLDGLGNANEGAIVTLYKNEEDYRQSENAVVKEITDNKGRVKFTDLKPIAYFIDARNGDMNNNGEGVKTAPLLEGRVNKVNTVIE
ncbi:MAG: carboxypeptidase regulatory-like domain-containing protein [Cyclobacteriaceae bacterium]